MGSIRFGIAILVLLLCPVDKHLLAMSGTEVKMLHDSSVKAVPKREKSELQRFASWFHQDWKLIYPDFHKGAQMYLGSLPPERRVTLKKELQIFLDQHAGGTSKSMLHAWFSLGAEAWQADLDITATFRYFVSLTERE